MANPQRYAGADDGDFYALLQVPPSADEDTIRQAYRRLAREYHPDVVGESGAEMMKRINSAYRTLSDPTRRHEYDLRRGVDMTQRGNAGRTAGGPTPMRPPPRPQTTPHSQPRQTRSEQGPLQLYRAIRGNGVPAAGLAFAQNTDVFGIASSDGHIEIWHLAAQQRSASINLHPGNGELARPGVLQELRLSPQGNLAMAWGLNLGTRVWNLSSHQLAWFAAVNGPRGAMDAILIDTPQMVRLALPAAPLALAEQDPFQWAEAGRHGTDILTRPLDQPGTVSPMWAVPLHCEEPTILHRADVRGLRIQMRALSWDGESLLTFATGPASPAISNATMLHLWNLRPHSRVGASTPQIQGNVMIPTRALWYPIAVSAIAAVVAVHFEERTMRLYDVRNGKHLDIPTGRLAPESRLALSPDGALLAVASPDQRGVELWSTATGKRLQTWEGHGGVTAISFALPGSLPTLAIGHANGNCEIWTAG